jgi:glycosyltransferase involved in cell wall biosynthesis
MAHASYRRESMRIAHVVHGLGIGGQERLIVQLSHELARRGHEPTIVSLSEGGAMRSEVNGIPVHDASRGFSGMAGLVGLFRSGAVEVVHTHNPPPLLSAMPAALLAGVRRRVHTKHGANVYGRRALWAARGLVRALDAVVAVSPQTADVARTKERVPEGRLRVVANGIPLASFHPDAEARRRIRAELGIAEGAFVVGSVGRLVVEKDYPLLVRAMAPLLSERVRLVIAGDGDARGAIEQAIPGALARWVTLTGTRRDVPAVLSAFDVFALSSRTEGLPLAVPEAMAVGLPIVATAVGGLPSVVVAGTGVLVASGDESALGAALGAYASDAPRVRATGEAARAHALATFSLERMADAYERIYRGD